GATNRSNSRKSGIRFSLGIATRLEHARSPGRKQMATSIRLFRGAFGHVSVRNVASDFVTHAHAEAHIILWLEGAAGEMTVGSEKVRLGPDVAAGINALQPHSHALSADGRAGKFLAF